MPPARDDLPVPENQAAPSSLDSPPWQPGTRLIAGVLLLALALLAFYLLRALVAPVVLAALLTYLLDPPVGWLVRRARLPRWGAVLLVYVLLVLLMTGATTGLGLAITQQIAGLVQDLRRLSVQLPSLIESLGDLQIPIGPWMLDLSLVNLQPILIEVGSALQPLLAQTGSLIATIAGATATAVGNVIVVMVFAFYLLLDSSQIGKAILGQVPPGYRKDFERLFRRTGQVWQAFLRGQLLLGVVTGTVVAIVLATLGVRFALGLGLIAGLLEFVPMFGPLIAGLIASLVALFQGSNWWGLGPLAFAGIVVLAFVIIQQVENNILVPRIIGKSLNLRPLSVLLAVLAGALLAGVLGVLLAAPVLATLRIWIGYIYGKTVGLGEWSSEVLSPAPAPTRRIGWLSRLRLPSWRSWVRMSGKAPGDQEPEKDLRAE